MFITGSRRRPPLNHWMRGGGSPVAVQMKVMGNVSLTMYPPIGAENVISGITAEIKMHESKIMYSLLIFAYHKQ